MGKKLKILIVEDEAITAETLRLTLKNLGYNVVGVVDNALDAIDVLMTNKIDLAILDIHIKGNKDGIWIANCIKTSYQIPFIFLTAFGDEQTVVKATETIPYGYLLKPFIKESLMAAIHVAITNFSEKFNLNNNKSKESVKYKENSIYIKHNDAYLKLLLEDLLFIESDKNYIQLFTEDAKFLVRSTLSKFHETLPTNFIQVHRSFIVNVKKIDTIKGNTLFLGVYKVSFSNSYKENLFKNLDLI